MNKGMGLLAFGFTVFLAVGTSLADYVVYTDRPSFEAALTSEATETFNEIPGSTVQFYPTGLTQANGLIQPLTITGSGGYLLSGSATTFGNRYPDNGTYLLGGITSTSTDGITVTLPPNTYTAVGADVANYTVNGTVSFSGMTSQGEHFTGSVVVDGPNLGFLGVATTTPNDYISSLTFSAQVGSNVNVVVDNVSLSPATVPEPASMALFGSGALVVGFGLLRRRFQKRQG